ncbi:hypothetical protein BHE74_00058571 [Ensete ventricosum]|nr:hypothetical protein GW17_00018608 [Ensete ventricosum]RWW36414.1 hypothetical protein BHE74_00058571 [Ensete ventricosum]
MHPIRSWAFSALILAVAVMFSFFFFDWPSPPLQEMAGDIPGSLYDIAVKVGRFSPPFLFSCLLFPSFLESHAVFVRMIWWMSQDSDGNDVNLGSYSGKVLLIVNVASKCILAAVFFRCVPSELPDPFGESPSELRRYPTASSELGPMPKLDLGPSSGCNFIASVIVRPARC